MRIQTNYSKKKRVLFIMTLPPPVHGSAVVCQYIKDSKIINESFDCDYVNLSTSRKVDEIGKQSPIKIVRLLKALIKVLCFLLTHQYDLCYLAITCHGKGFIKDAPFVLLCKVFGRSIVIHQHNKGMSKDLGNWPYRWFLPLCYKKAKVILLSWNLYPDIEEIVRKENVYICPNGIVANECFKMVRNNTIPRLLFLSNLMFSKGVLVLLDALKILREEGLSFVCDVVGGETKDLSKESFKEEIFKRGLEGFIDYHGKMFGDEKVSFFENADVFVHPTLDDCFPLVLLEAMQFSLPIVTTNEGGIPDFVKNKENGLISEKNNPSSLAKSIAVLLKDKTLREKYGRKGREIYEMDYSLNTFEVRMKEILDSCLNE